MVKSGVPEDEYNRALNYVNVEEQLEKIQSVESFYDEVVRIWSLITPEAWAYYELTEAYNLREWRLLRDAQRNLKKAWRLSGASKKEKHGSKNSTAGSPDAAAGTVEHDSDRGTASAAKEGSSI